MQEKYPHALKEQLKAVEDYQKAADQGSADAMFNLALCYHKGSDIQKDEKQAAAWFQNAAKLGHTAAMNNLGGCYLHGSGVQKDEKQAVVWLQKAAQLGHSSAMYNLALQYEYGNGVQKDEKQAVAWYQKAANNGYAAAMRTLGWLNAQGSYVKKDEKRAVAWYQKAAQLDDGIAQYNLAIHLMRGEGVSKDEKAALEWFKKSKENGVKLADEWVNGNISLDPSTFLARMSNSEVGHIHQPIPKTVKQQGPYCGSTAFAAVVNASGQLPGITLFATRHEKNAASQRQKDTKQIAVFEEILQTIEQHATKGPQYDVNSFAKEAKLLGIPGDSVILNRNISQEKFRDWIIGNLVNNLLIISCESEGFMPAQSNGKKTHWVAVCGWFLDPNDNELKLLICHQGLYCAWPIKKLYESNRDLPFENPNVPSGNHSQFQFGVFRVPIKVEGTVENSVTSSPSNDHDKSLKQCIIL